MTLSSIIADLTGNERTLTVYDADDAAAVASVDEHFAVQNVDVVEASAPEGPDNFAVLHRDGEFLAATDFDDLRQAVTFESGLLGASGFDETAVPAVLEHVSDTTFTVCEKRRMVLASREIEERAWRARDGDLHAGFQRLSRLGDQWDLYERIGDRGVSVHVYGVGDWEPPAAEWLTVHAEDADEIRNSWFVVFDAPDGGDCALLAEERAPDEFAGGWTYDDAVVADVLGHLRSAYR